MSDNVKLIYMNFILVRDGKKDEILLEFCYLTWNSESEVKLHKTIHLAIRIVHESQYRVSIF